jgi:hypothetical protein
LPQKRRFRSALARILRRWAHAMAPEEEPAPLASAALGQSKPRMAGQPPQHWLELVRRAAQGRMVTYRVTSPSDRPRVETEESASRTIPATHSAVSGPPNVHGREPARETVAPCATSQEPSGAAGTASVSRAISDSAKRVPQADAASRRAGIFPALFRRLGAATIRSWPPRRRRYAPKTESPLTETTAGPPDETPELLRAREPRTGGITRGSARRPGGAMIPSRSPGLRPSPPERKAVLAARTESALSHSSFDNALAPQGRVASVASRVRGSPRPFTAKNYEGRQTGGPEEQVPPRVPTLPFAKVDARYWPELPEIPLGMSTKPTSEEASRAQTLGVRPDAISSPKLNEGRWPELLEEPPSTREGWAEALRTQDRVSRLNAEQQGDQGWSA